MSDASDDMVGEWTHKCEGVDGKHRMLPIYVKTCNLCNAQRPIEEI